MAFVLSDRIKETTTTTGTGTYTLGGAVSGFETFTANLSNSDTTYYCCTDGTDFEVGLGTFTSSGTTLARTTIISSSNSNNAVSWSSGTRDIFCTLPGSKAVFKDGSDNINGTFVGNITGDVTGNASGTAATVTGAAQSNITSVGTLTGLTTSGTINLSQSSGVAIKTTGSLSSADLTVLRAGINTDSADFGFDIKYMGARSGNNNSYSLFMHNQQGTDVEAMTVLQDGKVGINNTSPSARLDVVGDVELVGDVTGLTSLTVDNVIVNGTTIGHTDDTDLITLADGIATVAGKLDAGILEGKGGVTYDPPGSSGTDTATDVAVAVHSGDRIVLGDQGYIRTIVDAAWGSALQFGQSGTGAFAGTEIYGGNSGVTLKHSTSTKLETTSDGATVTGDLTVTSTDAGASEDPNLVLYRNSSSPADDDAIGTIQFKGRNDNSQDVIYGEIQSTIQDASDGTEESSLSLQVRKDGSATTFVSLSGASGRVNVLQDLFLTTGVDMTFEGATSNANETILTVADPSQDNTITLPDATGTVLLDTGDQTLTGDLTLTSTDAGSSEGPSIDLNRNSASPATNDLLGTISFKGEDSASNQTTYAKIQSVITDTTDGSEDGLLRLQANINGTMTTYYDAGYGANFFFKKVALHTGVDLSFEGSTNDSNETTLTVADPTADRTITLPDATGTVLTTGNSDTPTTTTSSSDADFVLVDDGGTMKKITPANLGITSGSATKGFAVAMAIAL